MRKFYALVLIIMVLTPCQAKKYNLALNLEVGKEYIQVTTSNSSVIQEVNGNKMNISISMNGTMSYLVKAFENDIYEMDVKYKSLSMSMKMPQGSTEFSSENNDENDIFSSILREMKNKPFQIKMTKSGKIADIKNIELLFKSFFDKFPKMPKSQIKQLMDQLEKSYGGMAFKGNLEMATAIFPNKSVAIDDEWTVKVALKSTMAINLTTVYKLKKVTTDFIFIDGSSKVITADKDVYIESNGMKIKYDLKGKMNSAIKVDRKTGWIIEAKLNQKIEGETYLKKSDLVPNGMKIPMKLKNVINITNK